MHIAGAELGKFVAEKSEVLGVDLIGFLVLAFLVVLVGEFLQLGVIQIHCGVWKQYFTVGLGYRFLRIAAGQTQRQQNQNADPEVHWHISLMALERSAIVV